VKTASHKTQAHRFVASKSSGEVSAILTRPKQPRQLLVLGHGAGAGMKHSFMETVANELAANGVATFRFQFPYMENHKKAPDPQPILLKTVRSAIATAADLAGDLPLFAGGKSLGGRMTSLAASAEPLPRVRGLVFFGFPLHAPGKPSADRADHLAKVDLPMLFLQGTRDQLANLDLLRPVCERLGKLATLHIFEDGDHGFHVPKRSGKTDEEILRELAETTASWLSQNSK
jgi:hypothetical protein